MRSSITVLLFASILLSSLLPISTFALRYTIDTNLDEIDISFNGEYPEDSSGNSVAIAGDVNGDGFDDIIIGAMDNDQRGSGAGKAYLIFGKVSGWSNDVNLTNADASFVGEYKNDVFGSVVAGVGDVNNDGYDDFIVAADRNDHSGTSAGQSYLFFGKENGWSMNIGAQHADASFTGEAAYDFLSDISGGCDINGDGYSDILLSSGYNDENGLSSGKTYLFFGKGTGWSMRTNLSKANASFIGEKEEDYSGHNIACAGDVNGDHFDDFLIGSTQNDDGGDGAGKTYLIFGKSEGWNMNVKLGWYPSSSVAFIGEGYGDMAGSVDYAGDINGDGLRDILIGAHGYRGNRAQSGKTYLIFGKSIGWSNKIDLSEADCSFLGEQRQDWVGISNAGAGDVNGDGFDDFIIGTRFDDEGGNDTGRVYLILGKATGWKSGMDLSNADASFIRKDTTNKSVKFIAPAGAGDINGDGYDDILLGMSWVNASGPNSGKSFLIFPDINNKPTTIENIKAFKDKEHSIEISEANVNDTLYIQLKGIDADPNRGDITVVNVTSTKSPLGFQLRLLESGKNVGIYEGEIIIQRRTHEDYHWINAWEGDIIDFSSCQDPSINLTIQVRYPTIFPLIDIPTAVEDRPYVASYWSNDIPDLNWTFETNASWLEWYHTNHTMFGVPGNDDVGSYGIRIKTSHEHGSFDEHNFTLVVLNTNDVPIINSVPLTDVQIGSTYNYYVGASDIDKGDVLQYSLITKPEGMQINQTSGIITWTPKRDQEGEYEIIVEVTDSIDNVTQNYTLIVKPQKENPAISHNELMLVILILLLFITALWLLTRGGKKMKESKEPEDEAGEEE